MIFIDGDKFACAQCIRGHRSSTCQHTSRPLVMCRTRGRPALNAGHRIAVTEAIEAQPSSETTSSPSSGSTPMEMSSTTPTSGVGSKHETTQRPCCSHSQTKQKSTPPTASSSPESHTATKHTPSSSCCARSRPQQTKKYACSNSPCKCSVGNPILLQATKRSFVDFKGGDLKFVGPYQDQSMNNFKIDQTISKRPRHSPSPCCKTKTADNEKKNLSEFAVLKKLVVNSINKSPDCVPIQPKLETDSSTLEMLSYPNHQITHSLSNSHQPQAPLPTQETFNYLLSDGCTAECNCGPSCNCDTCLIHRTTEELRAIGLIFPNSMSMTPASSDTERDRSVTPDPMALMGTSINFTVTDELFMDDDCQCPEDACSCLNCIKHNIIAGMKFPQDAPEKDSSLMGYDIPNRLIEEHDCGCDAEACECFNCPKHGIINGKRVEQSA